MDSIIGTPHEVVATTDSVSGITTLFLDQDLIFPGNVSVATGFATDRVASPSLGSLFLTRDVDAPTTGDLTFFDGTLWKIVASVNDVNAVYNQLNAMSQTVLKTITANTNQLQISVSPNAVNLGLTPLSSQGIYKYPKTIEIDAFGRAIRITEGEAVEGVRTIITGVGLTGGTITDTGVIGLADTTVVAGAYNLANITVDAQGRITFIQNGALPALNTLPITGPLELNDKILRVSVIDSTNDTINITKSLDLKSNNLNNVQTLSTFFLKSCDTSLLPNNNKIVVETNLDLSGYQIFGLGQPKNATDVATKEYVDSAAGSSGLLKSVGLTPSSDGVIVTGSPLTSSGSISIGLDSKISGLMGLANDQEGVIFKAKTGAYQLIPASSVTGTVDQIIVDKGVVSLSNDPKIPGIKGVVIPSGDNVSRLSQKAALRCNTVNRTELKSSLGSINVTAIAANCFFLKLRNLKKNPGALKIPGGNDSGRALNPLPFTLRFKKGL